ncbi:MAG: hypothetical protein KC502_12030 [Myxococcales bacterium]|nr:hypothetical protein [Myxococcales bacterium]
MSEPVDQPATAAANERARPEIVYRWDLDKTYVQTDFSSVRGLLRAATEKAENKRVVPGMRALLTGLSRRHQARIIVVSGSPTQMRPKIERMFALHGVRCDRLVLKDFVGRVTKLRSVRAQVPYKLAAHLDTRAWLLERNADVDEICFGDDAEVDALIYCLYTDIVARRIDATRLRGLLSHCGAYDDEVRHILSSLAKLPRQDPVRRVFIHLDTRSPPSRYHTYQGRVTATFNALQIVLSLHQDGLAGPVEVTAVAEALVRDFRVDAHGLAGSIEDATRRGLCSADTAERVVAEILPHTDAAQAGFDARFADRVVRRLRQAPPVAPAGEPEPLAYEELFDAEHRFASARKMARKAASRVPGFRDFLESERE